MIDLLPMLTARLKNWGLGVGETGGLELLAELGERLALIVDYIAYHLPSLVLTED